MKDYDDDYEDYDDDYDGDYEDYDEDYDDNYDEDYEEGEDGDDYGDYYEYNYESKSKTGEQKVWTLTDFKISHTFDRFCLSLEKSELSRNLRATTPY